jgi:hypothetical protein
MKAAFDGIVLFEQVELKVGSWEREVVEKSAAGLDGSVSVDLGSRRREIAVRGLVWAFSDQQLKTRLDLVRIMMDGASHTLTVEDGQYFDRLRVDNVDVGRKAYSGRGVSCEFEAGCVQLGG